MRRYTSSCAYVSVTTLLVFSAAHPAVAGDPLFLCQSGQPWLWPNGGQNIPFNPDQGDLGPLTNAQAVALLQQAFDVWTAVPTATTSYVNAGQLPVDVDFSNFYPYYDPPAPDGLSAVVFDDTGEIFDYLFGSGSGVLAFSSPEWGYIPTCEIMEGVTFLNGPAFVDAQAALDVMVHEFGHYNNLAHVVVNGQVYLGAVGGDHSGPTPNNTFPIPSPYTDVIETMYPFYYGTAVGTSTLHADDMAMLSALYPAPGFFANTGTITGTIYAPDGTTKLTGVNVIARNVADPFADARSAISSGYTDSTSQGDPFVGVYTFNGLTPGADYAVYVDEILAGGFSTPPLGPLPGPEEFYNGADESNDPDTDDPSVYAAVSASAGSTQTGIDIIFNAPGPGVIPLGDDDYAELFLPFACEICGEEYTSVFVNSNGSVTFGAGDTDYSESATDMLDGPPRIAMHWDDLNPSTGGIVWYEETDFEFIVHFDGVPEYYATGANSFSVRIFKNRKKSPNYDCHIDVVYGELSASDGLAGVSCGSADTCGGEEESDLSSFAPRRINLREPAIFELFTYSDPTDLADSTVRYNGTKNYKDNWAEPNDTIEDAFEVGLPFDTYDARNRFSEIRPAGGDVDYYYFAASAGETLLAEVVGGHLDSVIGIFDYATGTLLDYDDDGGAGLLSRLMFAIPADGEYALAVTTYPDFDFDGDGSSGGRYCLDVSTMTGWILDLGDDDYEELPIGFGFPYQGTTWASVFVNSNGSLTFGGGDTDYSESVYEFLGELPRIAGLWDDLRPPSGGTITATAESDSLTIAFDGIPEYYSTGSNTFSFTLHSSGDVVITYGAVSASDGLVGVTEGNGAADPGETDLSAASGLSADGTTYELFTYGDPFDLSGSTLIFEAP